MINILVADDHAIFRKGVVDIISEEKDMRVVHEAKDAEEALTSLKDKAVKVVILDINLPGRSGLTVLEYIKTLRPDVHVLMLSINPEEHFAKRCIQMGASGYLNKNVDLEEFLLAIRKIAGGRKYLSSEMTESLLWEVEKAGEKTNLYEELSEREFEVLRQIAKNKTISEIAEILSLSSKTISTYKTRLMKKMNFKKTQDIVDYAVKHHLI